jgi:MYXO-CTERM domain-containing protein
MALFSALLTISSPLLAQNNDNDNDRKEKKDKDNNDSDNDGKENGFDDWGLLGLLGLIGLAGLRKNDDKHIHVDRRTDVPRSDSPIR